MTQNRYKLQAKGKERAELLIYGDIGTDVNAEESVDAKTVVKELSILKDRPIDVRINSIGGSVADGVAIHSALMRHGAPVNTYIDGVAYSIASLIAQAGRKRYMAENAMLMAHAPWADRVSGNAGRLRDIADQLDKTSESMVAAYIRPGGPNREKVIEWLYAKDSNHFFTAQEAKKEGLIDDITDGVNILAALRELEPRAIETEDLTVALGMIEEKLTQQPAAAGSTQEVLMDPKR